MNLAYGLYMAETEGYLSTRENKIQKVIKDIKAYNNIEMSESVFRLILIKNEIEPSSITEQELQKIKDAIK